MAGLLTSARQAIRRGPALEERVEALAAVAGAARGRLDEELVDEADALVTRAGTRLRLAGGHTVVALAGATGSGKSSTFNALCGVDLAAVGVRRPTTAHATACVWGDDPADALLEWLEVPPRHRVSRESTLDTRPAGGDLAGLVLLDLPDHDSTEVQHHLEVDRLVGLTDLMVWVLDPQKYADDAIHRRYLVPLAGHAEVILVVLNRIDEVPAGERGQMLADVRRLLEADGLGDVPLLATSARTGEGIDALRDEIAARVRDKATATARLSADVSRTSARLAAASGDAEPRDLRDKDRRALVDAMEDAAGVPVVVDAVRRATTLRGRRATGWPLTAWLTRLRPDPLRRLHLDRRAHADGRTVLAAARSSVPEASQVQHARVEGAVRDLSDRAGEGLAPPWARAVRAASTSRFDDLHDGLDRAVTGVDLGADSVPAWARGVRVLQWVVLVVALVGALWLTALAVMGYLQTPVSGTPRVSGLPVPTVLLVAGLLAGFLLALLSRGLVSLSARARARTAERRLREAVDDVATRLVVEPVVAELAAYRTTWEGLRRLRK